MPARVSSAILCDFAQVREGLLIVASGAVTRLWVPELPRPMGIMLAAVIEVGYEEIVHELVVSVKEVAKADTVVRMAGGMQANARDLEPGENLYVPIAIDMRGVSVSSYGAHDVHVSVDGQAGQMITFYVKPTAPTAADQSRPSG